MSHPVRLLSAADVGRLLAPQRLVDALAEAMLELSSGAAASAPRSALSVGDAGVLLAMSAHLPGAGVVAKLVTVFPENARAGLPSHGALVAVFDAAHGRLRALIDGERLTALRTAAGSALATRLLAAPAAATLAVIGTGVQAEAHARMLCALRPLERITIAGRDAGRAAALAGRLDAELPLPVRAAASAREALRGAAIVCTATHSPEPVLRRDWLEAGAHVNSVGVHPRGAELDAETVAAALVIVESRDAALAGDHGANELRGAVIDAEIGELLAGSHPGRSSPEQLTLYKSVGVAVQDAAAAALAVSEAERLGVGQLLAL